MCGNVYLLNSTDCVFTVCQDLRHTIDECFNGQVSTLSSECWFSFCLCQSKVSVRPSADTCVRADVRVKASARQSCSFYKNNSTLTFGLLHPPSESNRISRFTLRSLNKDHNSFHFLPPTANSIRAMSDILYYLWLC